MKLTFTQHEIHQLALQQLRQCGFKTNEIEVLPNKSNRLEGERIAVVDDKSEYVCAQDWPMNIRIKASATNGIIINRGVRTFMALPKDSAIIKGYGTTLEAAETDCWEKFKKNLTKN